MSLLALAAILFVAGAAIIALVAFVPDRRAPVNAPGESSQDLPSG